MHLADFVPWQYTWEMEQLSKKASEDESFLDDREPAREGDCEAQNPSTWDKFPHPVDCADTRKELENAVGSVILSPLIDAHYWLGADVLCP